MKKIDVALVADILFYAVSVWFISIGLMRYFRLDFPLAAILASLFTLAGAGVAFLLLSLKHGKRRLNKKETQAREALLLHLALEKEERVRAALLNAYLADGKEARLKEEFLVVEDELLIPRFTMQPLSADEIARLIRAHGKPTILCNALSAEAEKLANSFGLKIVRKDEIYALFTRTKTTPDPLILAEVPRKTVRGAFRKIVSKKSARPFFTSGILLLFMSLFTFFPIYYLVSGCILTLLSIGIRLFGFTAEPA